MIIDIIFIILMLVAVFRGMRRGLLVAIFSVIACIAGLAAAIKLSAVVADHLRADAHIHSKWLPIIAFILVFVAVVVLVRWIANLIETALDFAMLGWLNKIGGVILYVSLFIAVYSIVLFYGTHAHIISKETISSSKVYSFVEPWGPAIIDGVGAIVPLFKNMFKELEDFFSDMARKAA
ncbi:MAG: CvpA family protein [Bacteroidetes bacterium]|nr:CvpA family protein [Bacteroidota bacterium]